MTNKCFSNDVFQALNDHQPLVLVDVREPVEYAACHINGSLLQPLSELDKLDLERDAKIVLVCRSGRRAGVAAERLARRGYSDLSVLEGGIQAWQSGHLPVDMNECIWSLERQVRFAAGFLVLMGTVLSLFGSKYWLLLPGIVGPGLIFTAITDNCIMALMLAKAPWNRNQPCSAVTK